MNIEREPHQDSNGDKPAEKKIEFPMTVIVIKVTEAGEPMVEALQPDIFVNLGFLDMAKTIVTNQYIVSKASKIVQPPKGGIMDFARKFRK